jgi:GNAT superfamily N-acetyltransferase
MAIRLVQPRTDVDWAHARRLVEQYAASLGIDLSFQAIDHELEHMADQYAPPTGAFVLAEEDGIYVGCAGLRRFGDGVAEMKRMYVVPALRGRGLGRVLAERVVRDARDLGYARIRLDTLPTMREAHALYSSLGFRPIAAYRSNPIEGTTYLELALA